MVREPSLYIWELEGLLNEGREVPWARSGTCDRARHPTSATWKHRAQVLQRVRLFLSCRKTFGWRRAQVRPSLPVSTDHAEEPT